MNHDLPQTWIEVPFGELNQFASKTVDPAEFPQETFELYSVPSFPSDKPEIVVGASIGSTKQSVEPYDVLVCKINPRINRVWQVGPAQQNRQIASSEWIGFRCHLLETRFFRHFFSSPDFRELICTDVTGVGGSLTRAQPKKVATFSVPVAPLSEQTRIADKLDAVLARVDACRDRLDRIPAILKRFRQSVLAAATSGALTEDWRTKDTPEWTYERAVDVCSKVQSGGTPKEGFTNHGIPFLKVYNIVHQKVSFDHKPQYIAVEIHNGSMAKSKTLPGDVLMNIVGPPLGKVAVVPAGFPEWNINQAITLFRPSDRISTGWLYCILCGGENIAEIVHETRGSAGQTNISLSQCRDFIFPVPSVDEQTEIVRRVETLFAFADRLEARYTAAHAQVEKLTPSLLAKAFRGELIPQDPNDEPASELLARIHTQRNAHAASPLKRGRSRKAVVS